MKIAFNTANLVGRVTGYHFKMSEWGEQHRKTALETGEKEWDAICRDIAATGFTAIEIWQAHAEPGMVDEAQAKVRRRILDDCGLTPIAYAGTPVESSFRMCEWLGIEQIVGGLWGADVESASKLCAAYNIRYQYENHPEKSVDEIRARIAKGDPRWIGLGIDTGWLGTGSIDAPRALHELGTGLVRHVHLKDVASAGGHETVPIGDGVVDIRGCIATLKAIGYEGWYCWEDEPEDRNPLDIAVRCRELIEERLSAGMNAEHAA